MNVPSSISWQDRDDAGFMSLRVSPRSAEARAFVSDLFTAVVVPAWPSDLQKRPSSLDKHQRALAGLLGDLLRLQANGQAGKHGMAHKDFNGLGFSRDAFKLVKEALEAAGLLETLRGWQWFAGGWEGSMIPTGTVRDSSVSCFRFSAKGLELAKAASLLTTDLKGWMEHWERPRAALATSPALVELRGLKGRVGARKASGQPLPVDFGHPKVAEMVKELAEHNAFVIGKGVDGVLFAGLKRVFNNGDVSGFDWQWGGRFASLPGGGYECERKADRSVVMRLGGEPVAEIDLRASHLTIAYGLAGMPFDPATQDPYAVGDLDRELVKRWITQAFGRGDTSANRWSDEAKAYYATVQPDRTISKDVPIARARELILAAHPILTDLGSRPEPTVHSLLFHESQIMQRAMSILRKDSVPSLPVHDCLIVPASGVNIAHEALKLAFVEEIEHATGSVCSVIPAMTLHRR